MREETAASIAVFRWATLPNPLGECTFNWRNILRNMVLCSGYGGISCEGSDGGCLQLAVARISVELPVQEQRLVETCILEQ
jgi:hypothetical protein